jgi:hypothetical protein
VRSLRTTVEIGHKMPLLKSESLVGTEAFCNTGGFETGTVGGTILDIQIGDVRSPGLEGLGMERGVWRITRAHKG